MDTYKGKYQVFDRQRLWTYPLTSRTNKASVKDFIDLQACRKNEYKFEKNEKLQAVANKIVDAYNNNRPVFWMMGAHAIRNGLSSIIIDWLKKHVITVLSMNTAAGIHDFEFALIGETSESVPKGLSSGNFGFAYETGKYINNALRWGAENNLGYGESMGSLIAGKKINHEGLDEGYSINFPNAGKSIIYRAYKENIPVTVHATIGTDIIDQHPNFSAQAKGKTSGFDFDIFNHEVTKFNEGGIFLNVGTAVTGPEVLLKAVSMVANAKYDIHLDTADFDIRSVPDKFPDNSKEHYYYRDFKSVVTRIPASFEGEGIYIQGNHLQTIPALYKMVEDKLSEK